jgi:hypothetical protein
MDMMEDVMKDSTVKCIYFALVLVLIVLVLNNLWQKVGSLSEALTDWAAGIPEVVETPQGTGYVASPMPYGGLGGPNIRFNVLTSTNQRAYGTGYIERDW